VANIFEIRDIPRYCVVALPPQHRMASETRGRTRSLEMDCDIVTALRQRSSSCQSKDLPVSFPHL
jgi:hypothetical protein